MDTKEATAYSIVVAGAMNPRLHAAQWYRHVGLLSEEEEKAALDNKNTILAQPVSQIAAPGFAINCTDGRWEIKTSDASQAARIQEIAKTVFDDKIPHTPVSACGLNFVFVRDLGRSAAEQLAKVALSCRIDFGIDGVSSAALRVTANHDSRVDTLHLSPAAEAEGEGDNFVQISVNYHYPQRHQTMEFKLGPVIGEFTERLNEFEQKLNNILSQLRAD